MEDLPKAYVGDGVYIQVGGYLGEWFLTTEDGISVQNTIVVDDGILQNIMEFTKTAKKQMKAMFNE